MPQLDARVVQLGWGGERARDLAARLEEHVLPYRPTVVTLCYGMNDGDRMAYSPAIGKAYEEPLRAIVKRLQEAGTTVVVGSPGVVDSTYYRGGGEPAKVYNETLGQLRDIARQVAADTGSTFADVHAPMMEIMGKAKAELGDSYDVAGRDGVHPNANGHLVMAYAFLKAMGCDGDLGTITVDLGRNRATAVNGHSVLSYRDGAVEIESTRYPFCFRDRGGGSIDLRTMLPFVPFEQELNRLTLVVANCPTEQATVTWGATRGTFARADLEKGINLAAEFLGNPFVDAFFRVDAMILAKQRYDSYLSMNQIGSLPTMEGFAQRYGAETAAQMEVITKELWVQEGRYQDLVQAAVRPVKHTITVSPLP
jgi:lysophospholipase L1-like esterase